MSFPQNFGRQPVLHCRVRVAGDVQVRLTPHPVEAECLQAAHDAPQRGLARREAPAVGVGGGWREQTVVRDEQRRSVTVRGGHDLALEQQRVGAIWRILVGVGPGTGGLDGSEINQEAKSVKGRPGQGWSYTVPLRSTTAHPYA